MAEDPTRPGPQTIASALGLSPTEAFKYARNVVDDPTDRDRRAHAALIDALLEGRGAYAVEDFLRRAMLDELNRHEHRVLIAWCEANALLRRVVGEVASVYDEPATRTVGRGQAQLDALGTALQLDLVLRGALQRLVAHGAVWISARVRDGQPVLDVRTPAVVSVLTPTTDQTHVVGVLVDLQTRSTKPGTPAYHLHDAAATYVLDAGGKLVRTDEHGLGALPGVLVTLDPPAVTGRVLPLRASHDLVAAEVAGAFQVLVALRESVTVQKQAYMSGDLSAAVLGQSAGSQREIVLPEGVTVTAVDRSVDTSAYLRLADALADTAAANHGLAPATRKLASAASGYELWLRAVPLVRRRRLLVELMRDAERRLADHLARVVDAAGLEAYRFDPRGFEVRFGEVSMVQSEAEALQNFETRRRLGLDDTISEVARREQITEADAAEEIALRVERESARVELMQSLAKQNASASTPIGDDTNLNRNQE